MSFSFEFNAKPADVPALVDATYAPDCVKDFIRRAVTDLPCDLVAVKAHGHLFSKDYQVSNATITVTPIAITTPKV